MHPRALAPIAVAALLGAGCGGQPVAAPSTPAPVATTSDVAREPTPATTSDAPTPTPTVDPEPIEPDAPTTTTVSMTDFDFAPATIEVATGDTVTWTNDGSVAHTATVDGGPDTGTLGSGESGTLTFTEPGTYDYRCRFHPADMQGVVVVGWTARATFTPPARPGG